MLLSKVVVEAAIVEHEDVAKLVKKLTVYAPQIAEQAVAGQFIHVRVADTCHPLLRRPLSISGVDADNGTVSTIYRIVGRGTAHLATLKVSDTVDCMGPLGNGFNLDCERPLLVGGGMGLAPLVFLAQRLCPRPIEIVMGGRTRRELFWTDVFAQICSGVHVTTDDGSLGHRGFAVDILPDLLASKDFDMVYACGPHIMLEKVAQIAHSLAIPCQVSLEEYMACGVGACLSCTCAGNDGTRKKVCTDGPVFWAGEVIG